MGKLVCHALKLYWQILFILIYPLVLLPVFLTDNTSSMRCFYVLLLMAGYWMFEALPLAVTSMIPIVLFPLMGILDTEAVCMCYLKETNMMFIGGLIIAISVEHCNLHTRIALNVMRCMGCSPKRLNLGLVTVTMFTSMWISNTAATAMMIPIVDATLKELEEKGIGDMFIKPEQVEGEAPQPQEPHERRPTNMTMCFFISTAYASSVGGIGCIIGTGTNLTFKGLYETLFPDSPGVEFNKWMILNVPIMLVAMYLSLIWLQFWYLGLFRPNSKDAQAVNVGKEGEEVARNLITNQINEMGPLTFHEFGVLICFITAILLWFFRRPEFIPGWPDYITEHKVKDATAAIIVTFMLFMIPARPDFRFIFSKDEEKRPRTRSEGLITWKVIQYKMPWGLIFLLGGGFALAEGSKKSGMSQMVAEWLIKVVNFPRIYIMLISSGGSSVLTQFISSNVAVANIILPILGEMSVLAKVHPMYLMMPATLCCSFAYCLAVSTPPNAIAVVPCNMTALDVMKVGTGMAIICTAVVLAIFPFYGPIVWDLNGFPSWAQPVTTTAATVTAP